MTTATKGQRAGPSPVTVALFTAAAYVAWQAIAEAVAPADPAATLANPVLRFLHGVWVFDKFPGPDSPWADLTGVFSTAIVAFGVIWIIAFRDGFYRAAMGGDAFDRLLHPDHFQRRCAWMMSIALVISVITGAAYDHRDYMVNWLNIAAGGAPWPDPEGRLNFGFNPYGPLFNWLAPLVAFDRVVPKLAINLGWIVGWLLVLGEMLRRPDLDERAARRNVAIVLLGPYFWICAVPYGVIDVAIALSILFAVHLRYAGRPFWSGALLAFGVLIKFYPLAVLPFLMLERRRLNLRPALACLGVCLAGFGAGYAMWGWDILNPILINAERGPKMLSIFRFLAGDLSPIQDWARAERLHLYGIPAMALVGGLVFVFCWWRRIGWAAGATLALIVVFLFYAKGHFQYFTVVFVMAAYWWARDAEIFRDRLFRLAALGYLGWITLFVIFFEPLGHYLFLPPFEIVRDVAGLPAFLFGVAVLWRGLVLLDERAVDEAAAARLRR